MRRLPIGGGHFGGVGTIALTVGVGTIAFTGAGGLARRALQIGHGAGLRGMHGGRFLPPGCVGG